MPENTSATGQLLPSACLKARLIAGLISACSVTRRCGMRSASRMGAMVWAWFVAPPVLLAPFAAIAHRHHHRHRVLEGEAGDRLAALADAGVLHDHQRALAGEIGAGADPRHVALVRDLDVADRVVRRAQPIDAGEQRFGERRHDADIGLLEALDEQPRVFRNRVRRHGALPSAISRKLSAKAWPRSRAFFFITPSPNLPSRPNTETSEA